MRALLLIPAFGYVLISLCSRGYYEHDRIEPIPMRIPEFTEEICVNTEQDEFVIRAREGDCLSSIVKWCLNRYLRQKGFKGVFRFGQTLHDIVNSIETRSGNHDLIYQGEVISVRLPAQLRVWRLDYYRRRTQIYGINRIKKLLDFCWLIPYTENVFDCSERTAFLEYYLENEGFNTSIVGNEDHAWCVVEVEPGKWVNVECSCSPQAIGKAPDKYIIHYENINEAMEAAPDEFDWWNTIEGGEVIGRKR
jgi:hypothetical protein